jgi:hypothetical protein
VSKGPVVTAPFDKILPSILTFVPTVIAALLSRFPAKTLLAPSVVAPTGTQDTLLATAFPARLTIEPATVLSAPPNRKMKAPSPLRVVTVFIETAPAIQ